MTERISAERAREMLEAASPGAWVSDDVGCVVADGWQVAGVADRDHRARPNAALVAAAPSLCRTVIAQAEEIDTLRAVVEAARNRDGCDEHCRMMTPYRGCTCGDEELQAALSALDAMTEGS